MNLLVQTDRILANYRILNKQAGGTPLIPVLEANAYGLGDVAVAKLLAGEGVRLMAVSRLDEAVRVSEAVRGVDVMLLTPYANEEDIATILQHDIIGAVGSNDSAVLYSSLSRKLRTRARVQLCFDFGTGRFGFEPQEAAKAAQTIKHLENVELTGVFTILPSGAKPKAKVQEQQLKDFQKVITAIEREGLQPGITHMADTAQAALCPRTPAVRRAGSSCAPARTCSGGGRRGTGTICVRSAAVCPRCVTSNGWPPAARSGWTDAARSERPPGWRSFRRDCVTACLSRRRTSGAFSSGKKRSVKSTASASM